MTKFAVAKNLSNDKIPSVPVLCRLSLSVVSTIVAILILASFAAAASSTLTAFKTLSPIVLDGNLSEQAWRQANSVTFLNRQKSDNVVTVSALWDDVNLYLAYDVDDDQLEAVNDALSLDDGAEFYIDAQNNKSLTRDSNDYSFFANINDITKPTSIVSKTTRRSGGYTMEIRIPWNAVSTVPAAGKVLGLLLANNDRDNGKSFQFDWLDLINSGSYNRPNLWGSLVLSGTTVGSQDFLFSVSNVGDKSVNAGSAITNTITAALISGASQQVSFSASGLPTGTTASFSQNACNLPCSSVLTVGTTATASPGTFPITITASGGSMTKTTTFLLTIIMAMAAPTAALPAVDSTAASSGLVGYWNFDDGTATDLSGFGNNGTLISNPVVTSGKSGNALRFDGTNQINLPAAVLTGPKYNTGLTAAAWIFPTDLSGYMTVFDTANRQLSLFIGRGYFYGIGGVSSGFNPSASLVENKWQHVAITSAGRSVNIYFNGQLVASASSAGSTFNQAIAIAGNPSFGGSRFKGAIDELRIYNRALSAQEIKDLNDSTPPAVQTPTPLTATLLGQTGEDIVGTRSMGSDGVSDVHVRLSGVARAISKIRVTGLDGIWETPLNAVNWLVATIPSGDPSILDVFFDYFKPISSYTLAITYTDGQTETVTASSTSSIGAGTVGTPPVVAPAFDFSLVNGGNKSVTAGSSTSNTLTANLISGSAQAINFSSAGLPSGVTAGFSQTTCSPNCSSQLTFNTTAAAPAGSFPITVTATTSSGISKSTSFNLQISTPVQPFDFTLTNSGSLSVTAGSSTSNTVTASLSSGVAQQVSFSIAGLPSGAIASLSSSACNPSCSLTASVSSSASTAAGVYPLTVTGSGGGVTKSTSFTLSITAAQNSNRTFYVSSGTGVGAVSAGNDNNDGTESKPFKTLQKAISAMRAGDTLIVRGGEYDTVNGLLAANGQSLIPSGSSWNTATTLQAYSGEKPVFRRYLPANHPYTEDQVRNGVHLATPAECRARATVAYPCWSGGGVDPGRLPWQADYPGVMAAGVVNMLGGYSKYIVFDGIDIDARGIIINALTVTCLAVCGDAANGDDPRHLRFMNLELRNSVNSCMAQPGMDAANIMADLQFINVKIHHCGVPYDTHYFADDPTKGYARDNNYAAYYHGWYSHTGGNTLINSEVYKNAGTGVGPIGQGNIITGNYLHDNAHAGVYILGYAGGINQENVVERNIFWNNGGIELMYTGPNLRVSNNTLVAGPKYAANLTNGYKWGALLYFSTWNSIIENNIIDGFEFGLENQSGYGTGFGTGIFVRNNLIRATSQTIRNSGGVPTITSNNIFNVDPGFVSPATLNFNLSSGSPAIGRATDGGNIGAR